MADWSKPYEVAYRVMRVKRGSYEETAVLDRVLTGGSIERNQDTSVTESGSIVYEGSLDLGTDWLRVWADCEWHDGSVESVPLGTFEPSIPSRAVNGSESQSQIELSGLLQDLADDMFENPITMGKGLKAVDCAARICREAGLQVAAYDPGSYVLKENWTFGLRSDKDPGRGSSKLDAVNDLLDLAGFWNARTNPYGQVVFAPYAEPSDRQPAWSFVEGENATFLAEMTDELDTSGVKNVVKVIYYDTDREYVGIVVDSDPKSRWSTVSLGRRKGTTVEYSSIPESVKTDAQGKALAESKARELLRTSQSVIHRVTFTHAYAPCTISDAVEVEYPTGGVSGKYAVRSQHIELDAGIPTQTEARMYQRPS
ncbi:hypothetical protein [Bifidobacterium eulemuris]|uniref:Uncharacterized protein n=1 Tax=Bifidobacterium eulemuris TaxID=1765219 RepID=A0A261GAL2_9BIFI|nr:hypothetical protein [Bifidobacterium eulemuris]OZG68283.1 hypothetical protein BEUL_1296 [Bifidobacterium eulemuris]QOL31663.1 hypothetical protein BE0216_03695 [Bifidobacterium eulemuris]